MKNRFKQLCSALGYNQQSLAEKLSIDVRKLRSYLYETKNFPLDFLVSLNEILNVNINWLLTGKGAMFNYIEEDEFQNQNDTTIKNKVSKFGIRLSKIQEKTKLSDINFAKLIGIYTEEFIELKSCQKEPNLRILNELKRHFKVSIDWLLYGD